MKKTTLRKTLIAMLAAAMCATGAVIPTSAVSVEPCADHTHEYCHISHGSDYTSSGSGDVCYYIHYTQCVYHCSRCGNSIMGNHTDSVSHDYELYYEAHNTYLKCRVCGYVRY